MRKVTKDIINAFYNHTQRTISNSWVVTNDYVRPQNANPNAKATTLFLHGHAIAQLIDNELWITSANWETKTTKERLNGLAGVSIYQEKFQWYLNKKPWDGRWVNMNLWNRTNERKVEILKEYIDSFKDNSDKLDRAIALMEGLVKE